MGLRGNEVLSGELDVPEGFEHWLLKFPAHDEGVRASAVEYAFGEIATAAGLLTPQRRLISVSRSKRFFAVKRFDRSSGNRRYHVQTLANLLHLNFRLPSNDYSDLLRATGALTRNSNDVARAFQQMVFNIVMHNRDDHTKNFAFVMADDGAWSLSPAYDLTFSRGPGGEHTMTVDGEGREPTLSHCLRLAEQVAIDPLEARRIVEKVNTAAAAWRSTSSAVGCSKADSKEIAKHIRPLR